MQYLILVYTKYSCLAIFTAMPGLQCNSPDITQMIKKENPLDAVKSNHHRTKNSNLKGSQFFNIVRAPKVSIKL